MTAPFKITAELAGLAETCLVGVFCELGGRLFNAL